MTTLRLLVRACVVLLVFSAVSAPSAVADDGSTSDFDADDNGNHTGLIVRITRAEGSGGEKPLSDATYDNMEEPSGQVDGGTTQNQRVVARGFCDHLYRDVVTNHPCWRRYPASEEEPPVEEEGVDPIGLLHTAVALARIDGAGLVVEPGRDWVYLGVPTLAHAAHQSVETRVTLFDLDVPVRFDAVEYVFDFHSGQPPVRTSEPGQPYPDMTIQGVYQAEHPSQFVTLTTMWDASVIHPVTGDVLSVPGALRTVETSRTFRVVRAKQRLIAPSEFGKPH